jgi:hypothetical protein
MRFIRREHIITTICNKEVSDSESIINVLEKLLELRIDFSLIIKKSFNSDYDYSTISYDKARVKKVDGENIDFLIFNKTALTTISNISINDIVEVLAITEKTNILKKHPEVTRFGLMDFEEEDDD